jgi:hypothetical protein
MPRGIPGSGPQAKTATGRGRGRRSQTLGDIAARKSGGGQTANDGANAGSTAAAATGRGRGSGRASAGTTPRAGRRSQTANAGHQQGENPQGVGGIVIETFMVPGRGGRPQQAEEFPFGDLDPVEKKNGELVGPSFLIPDDKSPDKALAAARKRHKGKTFMSRKMEGGVRIWRKA